MHSLPAYPLMQEHNTDNPGLHVTTHLSNRSLCLSNSRRHAIFWHESTTFFLDCVSKSYTALTVLQEWSGNHGGLIVSTLDSRSSGQGFEPWPGTLFCVLRQDTLLSQCVSLPAGGNPAMDKHHI